jgi:dolichol kinase
MDYGHVCRRIIHLSGPLVLVYYILPDPFLWISRVGWVLLGLSAILLLEAVRLSTGRVFFGLRDYEEKRLSAYAWGGIGVAIALLFFPMPFSIAAIVGVCWADPLIGEMRKREKMRLYPALPLLVYFLIVALCLFLFSDIGIIAVFLLSLAGSMSAIAIEHPRWPVDDDFLMLVVPLFIMTLLYEYFKYAHIAI